MTTATYTLASGTAKPGIAGLHDRPADLHPGASVAAVAATAQFVCREDDLPPGAAQNDTLDVDGLTYAVKAIVPDGTGLVCLHLERMI